MNDRLKMGAVGFAAGCVNGLLGTGGGMILVPLLTMLEKEDPSKVFTHSVAIIFPICLFYYSTCSLTYGSANSFGFVIAFTVSVITA